jgi:hypothetical protein
MVKPEGRPIGHCCLPADPKDSLYARKEAYHSDTKERAGWNITIAKGHTIYEMQFKFPGTRLIAQCLWKFGCRFRTR